MSWFSVKWKIGASPLASRSNTLRPRLNACVPSQEYAARFPAVNLYLFHRFLNPDCLPQKFRGCQRLDADTVELSEGISPLISATRFGSGVRSIRPCQEFLTDPLGQ